MPTMRLHKFLAICGVCSRRRAEEYILAGRVTVNGQKVRILGSSVDPDSDSVMFDGTPLAEPRNHVTIALHKPKGYVTSCRHPGDKIVLDLIDIDRRVYPIGRLDKDSTGLVLLTDDGQLHLALSHPSFDHEKEYRVRVRRPAPDRDLERLADGIELDGKKTRPAYIERVSDKEFIIILKEGRNRQIRRMVQNVENEVTSLHRLRVGPVSLGDLPEGRWRYLDEAENAALRKTVASPRKTAPSPKAQ